MEELNELRAVVQKSGMEIADIIQILLILAHTFFILYVIIIWTRKEIYSYFFIFLYE